MRTFPVAVFCVRFGSVSRWHCFAACLLALALLAPARGSAQDGSTSLQGVIEDASGARIPAAVIIVSDPSRGFRLQAVTDGQGAFIFGMLPPGRYDVSASAPGMATRTSNGVELLVGGRFGGAAATGSGGAHPDHYGPSDAYAGGRSTPKASGVSDEVTQQAIQGLPLNGRRFTDLALLLAGVTQDPRGLTSDSNGDLSFGGVRGFQNSFLVDGTDDNNSFFAQARGRYRAPYQFSNEVDQGIPRFVQLL